MSVPAKIHKFMVSGYVNQITERYFTVKAWRDELSEQAAYSSDRGFDTRREAVAFLLNRSLGKVKFARLELDRAEKRHKAAFKKFGLEAISGH